MTEAFQFRARWHSFGTKQAYTRALFALRMSLNHPGL
jgi:hypothetical protein